MLFLALVIIDIVISFVLVGVHYHWAFLSWKLVVGSVIYLIGKGVFFRDIFSFIDLLIGLYMLVLFFTGGVSFITWILLMYMIYKMSISFA